MSTKKLQGDCKAKTDRKGCGMKPYYQDDSVTIYNAFCEDGLQAVYGDGSETAGAIVTSPPYNLSGFHQMHGGNSAKWDYDAYSDDMTEKDYQGWQHHICDWLFDLCDGPLFYSHKNRIKEGRMISPLEWLLRTRWVVHQQVVLAKNSGANVDKRRFFPVHELIFVCFKDAGFKLQNTDCKTDVWYAKQTNRKEFNHPAVMNLEAAMNCIKASGAEVIMDPFGGVATTGVGAKVLGKKAVIFESSEQYCETGATRVSKTHFMQETFALYRQITVRKQKGKRHDENTRGIPER